MGGVVVTASDWGPDSPATPVIHSFNPDGPGMCGDIAPAILRGVVPPACELRAGHEGWHESSDGAKWSRNAAELLSSSAAPARTPVPADAEERDGREALSDDLSREHAMARVMDPNAHDDAFPMNPDRRVERLDSALAHAIAAVEAGFRLVSEDDATVDRVARAMHLAGCECGMSFDDHQVSMLNDFGEEDEGYMVMARAAVRALREAGQ